MTKDVISLSRRRLLQAALPGGDSRPLPALFAKAPMLGTQAPYFYRFKLGNAEATVVSDGPLPLGDPTQAFLGLTKDEIARQLIEQFPAAGERRAGAERADRQHRQPSGAVRHRHGQLRRTSARPPASCSTA